MAMAWPGRGRRSRQHGRAGVESRDCVGGCVARPVVVATREWTERHDRCGDGDKTFEERHECKERDGDTHEAEQVRINYLIFVN